MSRAKRVIDPITKERFFVPNDAGYGNEVRANLVTDPDTKEKFLAPVDTLDENGKANGSLVVDPITKIRYFSAPKAGPEIPEGFIEIYEVTSEEGDTGGSTPFGITYDAGWNVHLGFPTYDNGDLNNVSAAIGGNYVEMGDLFIVADNGLTVRLNADENYDLFPFVDADENSDGTGLGIYYYDEINPETPAPDWVDPLQAIFDGLADDSISSIKIYVNDDNPNYFVGTY